MPRIRTQSERTPAQALLKGAPKRLKRRAKLFFQVQCVVHTLLFGEQVAAIVLIGGDFHGHILDNFESISLQTDALHGVVRNESHLRDAECAQNLCAHAIIALIGVVSEMNVGIYGVESLFLEFIRRDFWP